MANEAPLIPALPASPLLAGRPAVSPLRIARHGRKAIARMNSRPNQREPDDATRPRCFSGEEWRAVCAAFKLSRREAETLGLVIQGLGNKEIARQLGVRANTVRKYVDFCEAKLGGVRRAALAHAAFFCFRHLRGDIGTSSK